MDEDPIEALEREAEERIDYKKANYELRNAVIDLMYELSLKDQEIRRLQEELEGQNAEGRTF